MRRPAGSHRDTRPGVIVVRSIVRKLESTPSSDSRVVSQAERWNTSCLRLPALARIGKLIPGYNG